VKEFCKTAETTGGVLVDNKSRVIKVVKIPVSDETPLPDVMRLALGYPFYVFDEQQTPLELDPAYGEEFTQKYNLKMAKLAFDVAELIKKIDSQSKSGARAASATDKPTIYLADCSIDRREDREAINSDLRLHGYPILAEVQLPTEEATFLGELTTILGRCKLSIHIIGSNYGVVPDGPSEKSVVVLENELAIHYSKKFGLKCIIWVPAGTKSDSPRQQEFIDLVLRDPQAQFGADLITGYLEELKAAIHAALKKMETPPPPLRNLQRTLSPARNWFTSCAMSETAKRPFLFGSFSRTRDSQPTSPLLRAMPLRSGSRIRTCSALAMQPSSSMGRVMKAGNGPSMPNFARPPDIAPRRRHSLRSPILLSPPLMIRATSSISKSPALSTVSTAFPNPLSPTS
jgi:hypothetical protein